MLRVPEEMGQHPTAAVLQSNRELHIDHRCSQLLSRNAYSHGGGIKVCVCVHSCPEAVGAGKCCAAYVSSSFLISGLIFTAFCLAFWLSLCVYVLG